MRRRVVVHDGLAPREGKSVGGGGGVSWKLVAGYSEECARACAVADVILHAASISGVVETNTIRARRHHVPILGRRLGDQIHSQRSAFAQSRCCAVDSFRTIILFNEATEKRSNSQENRSTWQEISSVLECAWPRCYVPWRSLFWAVSAVVSGIRGKWRVLARRRGSLTTCPFSVHFLLSFFLLCLSKLFIFSVPNSIARTENQKHTWNSIIPRRNSSQRFAE
ncbi:hypothetical protein K456DRAFT_1425580 [Colletotrichum gloeosporioides 23]|nr:hypothetical protein K456DRAFT_1425580 [Colletotrichum gloeosporioides 23]